ncbi:alpha/beta fold hydrolase [Xanthobacter sp. YC-JY1]|uniref:alpha/beta fold hydrolase n=1 Tax=Xanthobacter sp. YC-JY1 TaxID=2419844 RepID=UPI001F44A0C4|nr:alpha/beta hydrolase [Xanthobacter sp. YC-JY1]UJX43842.1 alpha/beta hydrolase [Xanthobacter sp. YC-JY1]
MRIERKNPPTKATSLDGTTIAYDSVGNGPPLVIVVGAFNDRSTGAPLADALASRFTVYTYDRRGRGESGDSPPYAIDREIEDLASIVEAAGGTASVFGFSSGAVLALRASVTEISIDKLVLFGAPIVTDDSRPAVPVDIAQRVKALVEQGKRGDAVELFQLEAIGMPPQIVERMRHAPFRPGLEAVAHTLFNDLTIIAGSPNPLDLLGSVAMPTLVIDGGDGPPWIGHTARVIAELLPDGKHVSISGLTQDMRPELLVGPTTDFLLAG